VTISAILKRVVILISNKKITVKTIPKEFVSEKKSEFSETKRKGEKRGDEKSTVSSKIDLSR